VITVDPNQIEEEKDIPVLLVDDRMPNPYRPSGGDKENWKEKVVDGAKTAVTYVEDKYNQARRTEFAQKVENHKTTKAVVSTAKKVGTFLWGNLCKVGNAIDNQISNNEKLSHAKTVTKTKLLAVGEVLNTGLVEVIEKVASTKKGDTHA
jgi:hypothetical protein